VYALDESSKMWDKGTNLLSFFNIPKYLMMLQTGVSHVFADDTNIVLKYALCLKKTSLEQSTAVGLISYM
jgi:hypothetical protein